MRAVAGLLVIVLVLSGCAASPGLPTASAPEDPIPAAPFTADTGAIDGLVIDESVQPVVGALLRLLDPRQAEGVVRETESDEAGRFQFGLLPPASYLLQSEHRSYGNLTKLVDVRAGEATEVRLVLSQTPSDEPYVQLLIKNGLINCAIAAVVVSLVCLPQYTQAAFGPYNIALFYPVPKGHKTVVVETDWANRPQAMRVWYFHDETQDTNFEGDWMGDSIGRAVLRKVFVPEVVPDSYHPLLTTTRKPFPPSDQNLTLLTTTYYDGSYQQEINATASPACRANPIIGYCSGVGFAIQYRYSQYVTIFVNEAPGGVGSYSAVPDR